jgi:hypothetical protein
MERGLAEDIKACGSRVNCGKTQWLFYCLKNAVRINQFRLRTQGKSKLIFLKCREAAVDPPPRGRELALCRHSAVRSRHCRMIVSLNSDALRASGFNDRIAAEVVNYGEQARTDLPTASETAAAAGSADCDAGSGTDGGGKSELPACSAFIPTTSTA